METELLQVASSFTCTPIEPSLRRFVAIPVQLRFALYAQMSHYMLAPDHEQISGTLVLIRVEDWLRDALKSEPASTLGSYQQELREGLRMRTDEFVRQIAALSHRGKPVWFLACPSTGWVSARHRLEALCQSYTNLLVARIRNLP